MRILFIHHNFPAQFKRLAPAFAAQGHDVAALCDRDFIARGEWREVCGVKVYGYITPKAPAAGTHPYLIDTTVAIRRGQSVARGLQQLKENDWTPDVVYVHTGWGEALFIKDIFPETKVIGYFEYYYHTSGTDVNFDPEFPASLDGILRVRVKNMVNLLSMESCDAGVTPTHWQQQLYPPYFRGSLKVIHDGIETGTLQPRTVDRLQLASGAALNPSETPIITFANRNFEPVRGFHIMMRALPEIQRLLPEAHVIMAGGDLVSYGPADSSGKSYREKLIEELESGVDWTKVHFTGDLAYPDFIGMLQAATVHVYWTIPFVLSWSLLEAMALGKAIVASDTPPVREVISDRETGLLTPFFEPLQLAANVAELVHDAELRGEMGRRARVEAVKRFDFNQVSLPAHEQMLREVMAAK